MGRSIQPNCAASQVTLSMALPMWAIGLNRSHQPGLEVVSCPVEQAGQLT
jgi:hypothetical protein